MNSCSPAAPRELLHLASASEERFFPGLHVALATAIHAASGTMDYAIHVIDGGITETQWFTLETNLRGIGALRGVGIELHRIPADHAVFSRFPLRRGSNLTYARLAIPHLVAADRVVYMDSDVLCLAGVENFWKALQPETPLVAVLDPLLALGRDKTLRNNLPRKDRRQPYFNAGIIGLNLALCRRRGFFEKIDQILGSGIEFKYADQSLLNLVFLGNWTAISPENNVVLNLENSTLFAESPHAANLHFVGKEKPWLSRKSGFYRYVASTVFDRVSESMNISAAEGERFIDPGNLAKAHRKVRLYKLLLPGRGRIYRRAIASIASAACVASLFVP